MDRYYGTEVQRGSPRSSHGQNRSRSFPRRFAGVAPKTPMHCMPSVDDVHCHTQIYPVSVSRDKPKQPTPRGHFRSTHAHRFLHRSTTSPNRRSRLPVTLELRDHQATQAYKYPWSSAVGEPYSDTAVRYFSSYMYVPKTCQTA